MPDWTYQTVFKPALFRLPFGLARSIALGSMGMLSRLPCGGAVISFFGHMAPAKQLERRRGELRFPSPVGLGSGIDPSMTAARAFARFGFGFIEIGPIGIAPSSNSEQARFSRDKQSLELAASEQSVDVDAVDRELRRAKMTLPILIRLPADIETSHRIAAQLEAYADAFVCPAGLALHRSSGDFFAKLREMSARVIIRIAAAGDQALDDAVENLVAAGRVDGLLIDGTVQADGSRVLGSIAFKQTRDAVLCWRDRLGSDAMLIAAGGIHEPDDALQMMDSGADLVLVDSGLVFTGPGLPKRINEAILQRDHGKCQTPTNENAVKPTTQAWLWAMLMGVSMFGGGLLAIIIASTRVVLPYDESMVGMTRDELAAINDHLLHFMRHDRVTLAGTMLADGILYCALAWWGIRRGWHWALRTVAISAFAGFFSFFLFLAFGYFDPFHAFVTAILFQFLLFMISSRESRLQPPLLADLHNDWRWRLNQWGQLIFVIHGAAIITAGVIISFVGSTSVFVPEDLEFMRTTAEHLHEAHPRLVPLVAHDRATFGGMLISCGVAVMLPAMWGFRRSEAWLWRALMAAGSIAYIATMAVHWHVGYSSLKHLLPAYGGLGTLWIGGALSYPFLCQTTPADK